MSSDMVPRVPPKSYAEIEEVARIVLHDAFGHIQNAVQPQAYATFFDTGGLSGLGLGYGLEDLPFGEEAKYDPGTNCILLAPCTYELLYADQPRARFTFAHELGHAVLHGAYLQEALAGRVPHRMYKRSTIPAFVDPEWQANAFAASFMMPASAFTKCVREGMTIEGLARYFKASPQAVRFRGQKLGL